jgi:hypothetical protein
MTRRLIVAVLAGAGLLLALLTAGCGHSDEPLPAASDPVAWAGRLCDSLQPLSALKNDIPNFNRNNPAESRLAMSQYFQRAGDAAGQSLKGLDQVGPSPIKNGDQVAGQLHGALTQLQKAYADAKTKVDAVDPNDPVGMGTQLPGILTELADATNNKNLDSIGANPDLNAAVRQAPSCSLVGIGGGTDGTSVPGGN